MAKTSALRPTLGLGAYDRLFPNQDTLPIGGFGNLIVLFATASLIGEGFDLPRLETLVLAMPLSFKGRLVQYAGRLHRRHEAKGAPMIFDYHL